MKTDNKRFEETIRRLVNVSSNRYGISFFESMAMELAKTLDADYTLIGELKNENRASIRTIAAVANGQLADNFEYALADTPCENVLKKKVCAYPSGVGELFPKDELLKNMGVEGYVGEPLLSSTGENLGLMVALYRTPVSNISFITSIFQIFSNRVAGEIEYERTEAALRDREVQHRTILQTAMDGFWLVDLNGRILEVNDAYCQMSGYNKKELIGKTIPELEADKTAAEIAKGVQVIIDQGEERFESTHRRKDGSAYDVEISVQYQPMDEGRIVVFIRDITEQKRLEKELRTTQMHYTEFINSSNDLVSYWKMPDGLKIDLPVKEQVSMLYKSVCLDANRATWEGFGFKNKNDMVGKRYDALLKERYLDEAFTQFVKSNYCINDFEVRETYPCGGKYYGLENWHGVVEDGVLTHLWAISRSVTDQRRAEEQIRTEKEFTDMALDAQMDTFFLFEPASGRALRWNKAFSEISGYTDEEIAVLPAPNSYYSAEDLKRATVFIQEILEQGTGIIELELICKDGRKVPFEYRVSVINDDQGEPKFLISIGRDISENKRSEAEKKHLERQFHQAQKMESIGRLAGGVAHDLNNLLSPILGYGEMLVDDIIGADPRREWADEILNAGMRARDLVRQLLAFSRKQALEITDIDLNSLLKKFEKLLRRTIREDVLIKMNLEEPLSNIKGDVGQLEQVVMNLAVNAQDAMPEGGELIIETRQADVGENNGAGIHSGFYVMLLIRDTGCGMDEEIREHIFEPFFTTKEKDKGTGLGLATVFGIVKQHRGHLLVQSEPGQGAVFKVYLPLSTDAKLQQTVDKAKPSDLRGSETILLVEDNEPVRDLAKAILHRCGYKVLVACSGQDAMDVLDHSDEKVHLLLTDVIMPKMNGKQLFERLSQSHPDIKALYMSGYIEDVIAHHGVMDEGVHFIQKPFTVKSLTSKVREVLESN